MTDPSAQGIRMLLPRSGRLVAAVLTRSRVRRTRGQSLVEFALVLPIMLLLVLIVLDFGRVYLGYINLQNEARIAANFAGSNPDSWTLPLSTKALEAQTEYKNKIINDTKATNCALPVVAGVTTVPAPVFTDQGGNGTTNDMGDTVSVSITCKFGLITPIISSIVGTGGQLAVSASAVFPVMQGIGGTSGAVVVHPTAAFIGTPTSGTDPLTVQFTDQSTNGPTAWSWDFDNNGTTDSTAQNPIHTFTVGLYSVQLVATNSAGSGGLTKFNYISVSSPPVVVDFTSDKTSGPKPLTVQFTDASVGSPTAWAWDFDNNGTTDSTAQNPSYTYVNAGTYSVKLTATFATGPAFKLVPNMITVTVGTCTVPNFAGVPSPAAQAIWAVAGFTTTVNFQQGNLPWTIQSQNQVVAQVIPCNSPITVSKN
jgi:PKD repeat protein